jgi:hypothetical protein
MYLEARWKTERGDQSYFCVHGGYYLQSLQGLLGRAQSVSWSRWMGSHAIDRMERRRNKNESEIKIKITHESI